MSRRTTTLIVVALAATLALGVVEPALAETTDIGKNVGNEVNSWAKGLLLGVAALVGLPALFRRDVGQGLVIVLITVLVGGFVFAAKPVQNTISSMWQTVAPTETKAK
jgi:hypothetical protein